jgi:ribosome-binding factor A
MKPHRPKSRPEARSTLKGPSQRQLRAGELIRHALVAVLHEENLQDAALAGAPVTVTQVRLSPDFRHATVFVEPLGGADAPQAVDALNRYAKFLRGRLSRQIDMKFTPDLKFRHDESFAQAERMARLFDNPKVQADLVPPEDAGSEPDGTDDGA